MKESIKKIKQNGVWKIGAICIIVGLIGFGVEYYNQYSRHPHRLITASSPVVLHWQPVESLSPTSTLIPKVLQEFAAQELGIPWEQIHSWSHEEGFAFQTATGQWVWALEISDKKAYQEFLNSFLVSGEPMIEKKLNGWKIQRPSFSSNIAFTKWGKWAIIAPDETQIVKLREGDLLVDSTEWKELKKDLPDDYLFYSYIDTQRAVKALPENSAWQSMKPLMFAFSEANQHLATAVVSREDYLQTYVKWLHAEDLQVVTGTNFRKIPLHARMVPADTFYWSHGQNLEGEYEAALDFWQKKYKELPLFVDGVFETYFQKYFGPSFSFRDNLLQLSDQEYSVLFDYDGVTPQTAFFIDLPEESKDQTLLTMLDFFKTQQVKKYPQMITEVQEEDDEGEIVTRTKIVPNTIDNISIQEIQKEGVGSLFFLGEDKSDDDFAIGIIGSTLIMSSRVELLQKIFTTYEQGGNSLSKDLEFSTAIENKLSPSPKHGHLNLARLSGVMSLISASDNLGLQEILNQVNEVSFASKKTPKATFINFILWENGATETVSVPAVDTPAAVTEEPAVEIVEETAESAETELEEEVKAPSY